MTDSTPQRATTPDDTDAFICAAKGEPYTRAEWEIAVKQAEEVLAERRRGLARARAAGFAMPERFLA